MVVPCCPQHCLVGRWLHMCVASRRVPMSFLWAHMLVSIWSELKSRQVRKLVDVDQHKRVYPYMSFYFPAMEAASTGQAQ